MEARKLKDLRGIGKKMLVDFDQLGVKSVSQLKTRDPQRMYDRMCQITNTRQDPCVLDTYRCAVEQGVCDIEVEVRRRGFPSSARSGD